MNSWYHGSITCKSVPGGGPELRLLIMGLRNRNSLAASRRRSEHSEQTAHKPNSNSESNASTESNADRESENEGRSAPDGIIIQQLRHLLIRMYVLRNTRLQV